MVGTAVPAKVTDTAGDVREIDRFDRGVGWLAHPREIMERASHALATDGGVYLVDPVDGGGVDDLVEEIGEVAGVVLLSNHHTRDGQVLARRHEVPVFLPDGMAVGDQIAGSVERFDTRLPGTDYDLIPVSASSTWQEFALFDGATLVVADSLGSADYFLVGDERLGVILLRRLTPPRAALGGLDPDRILVGHGEGVFRDAPAALADALAHSRSRFPRALVENGLRQARTVTAAIRT